MPLTDRQIRGLKPKDRAKRHFDGGELYLEVTPAGSRLWRYKYRIAGKERLLALGTYPEVSLKAARAKHESARRLVAEGIDPSKEKQARRQRADGTNPDCLEAVAREFVEKQRGGWAAGYTRTVEQRLENYVYPWIGAEPVAELTAAQVLNVLKRIEQRGAVESAHRVRVLYSQIMRYAVATQRAERDPVADLKGALATVSPTPMAAITDPSAIGRLLRDLDGYSGTFVTRCALRRAPYLFVRPGELRAAEWIEFDLAAAEWVISPARLKLTRSAKRDASRAHLVPLACQALGVQQELHPLTGHGRYLFPGLRSANRPMSENTVNGALRRLGYDKQTMTGHGFRALASTRLNEMGFDPVVIELQLAHVEQNKVRGAYNRARRVDDRRALMQSWADYLDGLRNGADVVAIRSTSA